MSEKRFIIETQYNRGEDWHEIGRVYTSLQEAEKEISELFITADWNQLYRIVELIIAHTFIYDEHGLHYYID